jgi:hypothetical protein
MRENISKVLYNKKMIKWNEVTWYSKLLAVILFIIIIPLWAFYLGIQVGEVRALKSAPSTQSVIL